MDEEDDNKINLSEIDILKTIEEDEDIITEHADKFVTKASTLVSQWQKFEAVKMKNDDDKPQ